MESDGGGCIVILADHDKIEMDDFLMDNIATDDRYGTKIVTREGNPADQWMLERASAAMARCVVVLTDPLNQDEGTAGAVRTMLALILGLPPLGWLRQEGHWHPWDPRQPYAGGI